MYISNYFIPPSYELFCGILIQCRYSGLDISDIFLYCILEINWHDDDDDDDDKGNKDSVNDNVLFLMVYSGFRGDEDLLHFGWYPLCVRHCFDCAVLQTEGKKPTASTPNYSC